MKNLFKQVLRHVVTFLDAQHLRYALIGGIANQVWGQARFTYDIDIKVLVPNFEYETLRTTISTAFPEPGRPDLPLNPLIVSVCVRFLKKCQPLSEGCLRWHLSQNLESS